MANPTRTKFLAPMFLVTALTALAIAVGGVLAHIRTLREVKAGNEMTGEVHQQLNSAKHASDKYQQDLRTALQHAGVAIPKDESLEAHGNALHEEKER